MRPFATIPLALALLALPWAGCHGTAERSSALLTSMPAESRQALFERARTLFYDAVAYNRPTGRQATAAFEQAHAQDPSDSLTTAYLGACRLLQAREAPLLWDKAGLAREGLQMMDRAVAAAPDQVEVRFVRGMTCSRLPRFFGRRDLAAEDLAWCAARAAEAAREGQVPPVLAATALYEHGLLRAQAGDEPAARSAWEAAVAVDPASQAGHSAAAHLGAR